MDVLDESSIYGRNGLYGHTKKIARKTR